MRTCIFCGVPLGANRAREHVLRDSWLTRLGHSNSPVAFDFLSGTEKLTSREFVADSLQTGEICGACNRGWMNSLDVAVQDIVLGLAQDPSQISRVTESDGPRLARWILKTAIAFVATDARARRHFSDEIISNLKMDGYIPSGFF